MCRTARLFLFYQPRTEGGFTRLQQTYSTAAAPGITLLEHMKTAVHDRLQTSFHRQLQRFRSYRVPKPWSPSGFFLKKNPRCTEAGNGYNNCETALARQVCAFTAFAAFAICFLLAPQWIRAQASPSAGQLRIYAIDVEGGQSTLLVGPSGASLLVDTGWPGHDGRDAERIQAAMSDAGIKRIDHVLITHLSRRSRGRRT